ncbi:MAG: response regulator transcription factor [Aquisalinus sp.]|nr:response regulator transcription factor [Aquisalinus sp.]
MKVLLADDHDLVRDALSALLIAEEPDIDVVTTADLPSALQWVKNEQDFDVIILDMRMPGMNGLDGVQQMLVACHDAKVVLMSGSNVSSEIETALQMGVFGFVPKTIAGAALLNAIKLVAAGEKYLPAYLLSKKSGLSPNNNAPHLTEREREVLAELRRGNSNKEISRTLGIAETTVKLHLRSLSEKLEARNRTDIVVRAIDLGLA